MRKGDYSLNAGGKLMSLAVPQVMGIINLTPDSFYAPSRKEDEASITKRVYQITEEGGTMIDVGAYSSRPGADPVTEEEEMTRLRCGLKVIRDTGTKAILSVDTFRANVARMCVEEYGVEIINDIAAGDMDPEMFPTIARLNVPYIMMHMKGTPQTMQQEPHYDDLMSEIFLYFSKKMQQLRLMGVKDIILDPGFGFGKTLDHNYQLLSHLEEFREFDVPILVGVSRKSMLFRLLGGGPTDMLNATTAVNVIALMKGANILRVHDVRACVEAVRIVEKMRQESTSNP